MEKPASEAAFRRQFPFYYEHEIEYREIDMLRHVNNVRFIEWAESLRSRFFEDVLHTDITSSEGVILARHDAHYLEQVAYREHVLIGGTVGRWGTKSFDFVTTAWSLPHERAVFHSVATLVAYDYVARASIAVPPAWRTNVAEWSPATP